MSRRAARTRRGCPPVGAHSTPAETGRTGVDGEDAILTIDARAASSRVHPTGKDPAAALDGWLGDWQQADRGAAALRRATCARKGNEAQFVEPATKGVEPIVNKMNDWILEQGTRTDALQHRRAPGRGRRGRTHLRTGEQT